jgi:hypothetical protein
MVTFDSAFLVTGRLFDYHILDMVEFGVEKFVSMTELPVRLKFLIFLLLLV